MKTARPRSKALPARKMVAVKGDLMHKFEVVPNITAAKDFIMRIKDASAITYPVLVQSLDRLAAKETLLQVAITLAEQTGLPYWHSSPGRRYELLKDAKELLVAAGFPKSSWGREGK